MIDVRARKLEGLIKVKLSELLLRGLKDPRLEPIITILDVRLSRDGRMAKIIVSVIGTEQERKSALEGLHSARGFIQKRLSKKLRVRYVPHLTFILDEQTEERVRLVHRIGELERAESESRDIAEEVVPSGKEGESPEEDAVRDENSSSGEFSEEDSCR